VGTVIVRFPTIDRVREMPRERDAEQLAAVVQLCPRPHDAAFLEEWTALCREAAGWSIRRGETPEVFASKMKLIQDFVGNKVEIGRILGLVVESENVILVNTKKLSQVLQRSPSGVRSHLDKFGAEKIRDPGDVLQRTFPNAREAKDWTVRTRAPRKAIITPPTAIVLSPPAAMTPPTVRPMAIAGAVADSGLEWWWLASPIMWDGEIVSW
jgi:hypothetical protein